MKVQKNHLSLVHTGAAHAKGGGMPGMARLRLAAISVFLFVFLVIAPPPVGAGAPDRDKTVGPGCDPTRTAVAYHAGGLLGSTALPQHQGNPPIPCAVV